MFCRLCTSDRSSLEQFMACSSSWPTWRKKVQLLTQPNWYWIITFDCHFKQIWGVLHDVAGTNQCSSWIIHVSFAFLIAWCISQGNLQCCRDWSISWTHWVWFDFGFLALVILDLLLNLFKWIHVHWSANIFSDDLWFNFKAKIWGRKDTVVWKEKNTCWLLRVNCCEYICKYCKMSLVNLFWCTFSWSYSQGPLTRISTPWSPWRMHRRLGLN